MSDYTELLKDLRLYMNDGTDELRREAADAIEELQAAVEGYEATTDVEFVKEDGHERIRFVPKWIPVTERLPSAWQVLINLHYMDGFNEVSLGEHWNCPDIPEEDGWGGFGGNGVVTHWMPLPEPPKEEPKIISAVDCKDCRYYPPSSLNGKPCTQCDMGNPLMNCFSPKEEQT